MHIVTLALGLAAIVLWLVVAVGAMVYGGGVVILAFNRYHEGWVEVAALAFSTIAMLWLIHDLFPWRRK